MPNIYDNITDETRLGLALRDSLDDFDTVDVATGYIDLRGWSNMADILDAKGAPPTGRATARVLVGMVAPSDSQQLLDLLQDQVQPPEYGADIHDRERALARRDQLVALLSPGAVRVPMGVVIDTRSLPEPDTDVHVGAGTIGFGSRTWRPTRWWDPHPRVSPTALVSHSDALARAVKARSGVARWLLDGCLGAHRLDRDGNFRPRL